MKNKETLDEKLSWLKLRSEWRLKFLEYHKSEIKLHYKKIDEIKAELILLEKEIEELEKECIKENILND